MTCGQLEETPSVATEFSDQNTARRNWTKAQRSAIGGGPASSESGEEEGPWYIYKAREEFNRLMRDAAGAGDDDPV